MFTRLKNVLVIDDSPEYLTILRYVLAAKGLNTICHSDPRDALKEIEQNNFELIISDFRMPGLSGLELLAFARGRDVRSPVILMTADKINPSAAELELHDCCATLLRKPLNMKVLDGALVAADHFDHHIDCVHNTFDKFFKETTQPLEL